MWAPRFAFFSLVEAAIALRLPSIILPTPPRLLMPLLPAILLVDDDATTNFINQHLLKRMGVSEEVLVALNGQEALGMLQARCVQPCAACPALVLLDINMPVMDGFAFLKAYNELPQALREGTVIVMLTTSMLDADMMRARQLPVAGFLSKPLTRAGVNEVLHRHFGHSLPEA
jgi:CheY-like chemotaxis protein